MLKLPFHILNEGYSTQGASTTQDYATQGGGFRQKQVRIDPYEHIPSAVVRLADNDLTVFKMFERQIINKAQSFLADIILSSGDIEEREVFIKSGSLKYSRRGIVTDVKFYLIVKPLIVDGAQEGELLSFEFFKRNLLALSDHKALFVDPLEQLINVEQPKQDDKYAN